MFQGNVLEMLKKQLEEMSLEDLRKFYNGVLNACAMASIVFERRFPDEFKRVQEEFDNEPDS